jgi:uncharacterized protein (TIGR02757 family)
MVTGIAGSNRSSGRLADALDGIYERYNRRSLISSDPLEFVYDYGTGADREVTALIASSLAFGNVKQIRASVSRALEPMGSAPSSFLRDAGRAELESVYRGFRHRWIQGGDLAAMLAGVKEAIRAYGSLRELFYAKLDERDEDVGCALSRFVEEIHGRSSGFPSCLLPSPVMGSACKRLQLFLRWMVRRDDVDPGGWSEVSPRMLIVPLDTHMFRICGALGFTKRAQADLKAAREATEGFRRIVPGDPVRYDFSLTRLGMGRQDGETEFRETLGLGHVLERPAGGRVRRTRCAAARGAVATR